MSPGHVAILLNTQICGSHGALGSTEWAGGQEAGWEGPTPGVVSFAPLGCEAHSQDFMSFLKVDIQASSGPGELVAPTAASPCPKSLSCSACGPISIATPHDATEERGSCRKVWGGGTGGPFLIVQCGSLGLGVALWGWPGLPAQVDLGSGPPARWSGGLPGAGMPGLAWARLACASLPGASVGGH